LIFAAFAVFGATLLIAAEGEESPQIRHIPWRFITYDAPGFDANPIGDFSAQNVRYHYDNGEGWLAITTYRGEEWVNYRDNLRRTPRLLGLHSNMGDTAYVDLITPQMVRVLQQDGRWLQIETHLGPRWVNLDFAPPTAGLQAALSQHGNRVSVFYKNMETGFTFTYNPDRIFFGASTNKIYSALYIYTLAERGLISMDTVHTYTAANHRGGSGRIQHMPFGTQFTTQELLNHSIRYSCNVAYRMLALRYTSPGFTFWDFVDEVGANRARILSLTAKNIDAIDAGIWMTAVFNYLESDGQFAHILREDLVYAFGTILSDNYDVALKYGWMDTHFHDMAIVYAPSPYVLIILSDMGEDPGAGFSRFAAIGRVFEAFNNRYFR